jgi:pyruvate-formate lyase-activating enzyme
MQADRRDETFAGCQMLNGRVDLNFRNVDVCAGFNNSPVHIPVAEFTPDLLRRRRREAAEKVRLGTEETCQTCPRREIAAWAPTSQIDAICIHYFTKCNLKCVYCYTVLDDPAWIRERRDPKYSAYDTISQLIDAGDLSKDARITWAGGEPTLGDEFESVIDLVTEFGAYVDVFTNAVVYSKGLARAVRTRPDRVNILCSIDAGTPATYARIKGADVLDKVWRNIGLYNQERSAVDVKYIFVDEGNAAEAEFAPFADACRKSGVRRVALDVDHNKARAENWMTPARFIEPLAMFGKQLIAQGFEVVFGCGVLRPEDVVEHMIKGMLEDGLVPDLNWQPHLAAYFERSALIPRRLIEVEAERDKALADLAETRASLAKSRADMEATLERLVPAELLLARPSVKAFLRGRQVVAAAINPIRRRIQLISERPAALSGFPPDTVAR